MGLLLVVLSLLLPHQYQVTRSHTISHVPAKQLNILFKLNNWPELMAWSSIGGLSPPHISTPDTGVGAHIKLIHSFGDLEMTIINQTDTQLTFSLLINNEHTGQGTLTITPLPEKITIEWQLQGIVHSSILGGYIALYCEYYFKQMLISATNNLNSQLKLQAAQ